MVEITVKPIQKIKSFIDSFNQSLGVPRIP